MPTVRKGAAGGQVEPYNGGRFFSTAGPAFLCNARCLVARWIASCHLHTLPIGTGGTMLPSPCRRAITRPGNAFHPSIAGDLPGRFIAKPIKLCETVAIIRLFAMGSMRQQVGNFWANQAAHRLWDNGRCEWFTLSAAIGLC